MRPWFSAAGLVLVGMALAAAQNPPRHLLRPFLARLKGVPAAYVEQRPHLLMDRVRLVEADWKRMGAELAAGLPEADRTRLEALLARLGREKGLEAARTALEAQYLLAGHLPAGQDRATARVDRDLLDTWLCAEEGRWQAVPELRAPFAAALQEGDPSRAKLSGLLRDNLKKLDLALRERDKAKVQLQVSLLRRLLEELELR